MNPIDQPPEHHTRQVRRVLVTDLQPREHLLPLPLNLDRRERRVARDVRDEVDAEIETVRHDQDVDEAQVRPRAHTEEAADSVDALGDLGGVATRRALVEQLPRQRRNAVLAGGVRGRTGADHQPQVDRRLLVMRHHHDLEPIAQRTDLIGREGHLTRR